LLAWLLLQAPAAPPGEALRLIEEGRAREAVPLLEEAARKEPDSAAIHFQLGYALSEAGETQRAIAAFRRVLEIDAEIRAARLNLAHLLIRSQQPAEAVPLLEQCLREQPEDAKAAFLLGRALGETGQWRAAAEAFETAARKQPDDLAAAMALAEAWERAGEKLKAAAVYARFPGEAPALERLGVLELESGDLENALLHLEAARAKSATPAVLYALATAYLRHKKPEQSAAIAALLVQQEPANAELRLFYGRLLRDQKKYAEAAPQFQEAVRLAPRSGEAWNEFTAVLMLLKQYEPALAALDRARELNGDNPAYDYFRATMLDAMSQAKAALESYRRFLASSNGAHPDEEFKARQRVKVLQKAVRR